MVEIFKITGKRITFLGIIFTLVGMFLLGYHIIIYDLIFNGKLPETGDTIVAIGSIMLMMGPWIIRARGMVQRAVN